MTDTTAILRQGTTVSVQVKRIDSVPGEYPIIEFRDSPDRVCIIGQHDEDGRQLLRDLRAACDAALVEMACSCGANE